LSKYNGTEQKRRKKWLYAETAGRKLYVQYRHPETQKTENPENEEICPILVSETGKMVQKTVVVGAEWQAEIKKKKNEKNRNAERRSRQVF